MSDLVEELKKEHLVITDSLNKVKNLGIASEEGQKTLVAVKSALLAHLHKEDERLYTVLYKAAVSDVNLKQSLDMFAKDMGNITKTALDFFEKYSKGGTTLEFAEDFGQLCAMLSSRISKEENILYKRYDELIG